MTDHRKTPVKGLIGPGSGEFPCGIDDPRVLSTDTDLHSLIYDFWELRIEMSPTPGNGEVSGKGNEFHATRAAESATLCLPFVFVPN